tara:strand:+ start:103 stop:522 length:420 start_codon:yes stop_codon:yes gene_type:complete
MKTTVETEIELLKREVSDMKQIHVRLDTAIEKIADVSSSLHTIMAVHEEKLVKQEEALTQQEEEFKSNIELIHTRITTKAKETTQHMQDMERRLQDEFIKLRQDLNSRVGVLEKWRWLIIGGAIVIGFITQTIMTLNLT